MDEHDDTPITDAYARLGTALLPPPDVAVRVERELGARRRRRRTAWVGAAALVVAGTAGGAVVLGSGDSPDGDTVATDPQGPQGSFTLTRADGSQVEFHDFTLSCDTTPLGEPAEPGHIYLWSPFHLDASGKKLTEPYVMFEAATDQVDGKTFTLPVEDTVGDSGYPVLVLFAAEADATGQKRPNEVSSAQGDATGTVHVAHASCDPTPILDLTVDTTLGSELEQGSEDVAGSYR